MNCDVCGYYMMHCRCPEDEPPAAQAEIARLQAEVECTNYVLESQAHVISDLRARIDTAHNDAIEAAASAVRQKINWHVSQADWSTSKAGRITHLEKANALKDGLFAIRAIKRPT